MIVLGVDPGSRWCAASAIERDDADALRVLASRTFDVNPTRLPSERIDVGPVVAWVLACAAWTGAETIAIEHAWKCALWPGLNDAARTSIQANWNVCDRIVRELIRLSPLPVEIVHVQTWRSRLLPKAVKGSDKERADVRVAAALHLHLPPESIALLSVLSPPCETATHQRDAAGAALGYLLAPLPKAPAAPRVKRDPGARPATRNAGWLARRAAARLEARRAAGCDARGCTPYHHRRGCPLDTRAADYRCPKGVDPLDVLLGL